MNDTHMQNRLAVS